MNALPLVLLLAAAPALAQETSSSSIKTVHLFYNMGVEFSVRSELALPLETVLSSDAAHFSIRKIKESPAEYSRGAFLFDLPFGVVSSSVSVVASSGTRSVSVLDSPSSVLLVLADDPAPLLDRIQRAAADRDEDKGVPGTRRSAARLSRATLAAGGAAWELEGEDNSPGRFWTRTIQTTYSLETASGPATVIILGKPLGGPDAIRALLDKRLKEVREPTLLFSLGEVFLTPNFAVDKEYALDIIERMGYRFLAFQDWDIENGWDLMIEHARRPKAVPLLCTNISVTTGTTSAIETVDVETVDGIKFGFLSLIPKESGEILERRHAPYSVRDPIEAAEDALKTLRQGKGVDLVVAISHLSPEDSARLLDQVHGIDIYIDSVGAEVGSRRSETVELADWGAEWHRMPALRVTATDLSYDELAVSFQPLDDGYEPVRIAQRPGPTDPEAVPDIPAGDYGDKALDAFVSPQQPLLPDPRRLWPDAAPPKRVYFPPEFWDLAAQLLRRDARTETALLRIKPLYSNRTGNVFDGYVSQWLSPDEHVVTARLPGSALKALRNRFSRARAPMTMDEKVSYESQVVLAGAGIDAKGRISGLPIADDELYTVATTSELLQKTEELPELKQATDVTPTGQTVADVVMGALKARRSELESAGYQKGLRDDFEGKTPESLVWRLDLRQASLEFANTQVISGPSLADIRDARVQAQSQLVTTASERLFSEMYWGRLRWTTGLSADYGQVTVHPPGAPALTNVTQDQAVAQTEVNHRSLYLAQYGLTLGPFLNISYNTQFTRPPNTPRAQVILYKTGAELFDGTRLKQFYVGPAAQTDYSFASPNTQVGYAAGFVWDSNLPGTPVTLHAETSYLEFLESPDDTVADVRRTLDVNVKLGTPFLGRLKLSPYLDYYLFQGALTGATGYNFLLGVSLDYSQLWKPFF